MEKVLVRNSPIHGRGVFAARRIEPGEIIIDGCRDALSEEALASLPPDEKVFLSVMNGQHVLMKPPARFVNHSCSPNAQGTDQYDVAMRVIEAGEEITVDYAAEHASGAHVTCNCKAPNCRGFIVLA